MSITFLLIAIPHPPTPPPSPLVLDGSSVLDVWAILSLLRIPAVALIITLKTVVGIPAGVWHSMFAMVNIERLGLSPVTNGYIMSYVGVITIVSTLYSIYTAVNTQHRCTVSMHNESLYYVRISCQQ